MPDTAPLTLLLDAQVFAPEPLGRTRVLLAGGRVAAVGPDLAPPPGGWPLEIFDLGGRVVIPGLLDLHVHLDGGGGEGGPQTRVPAVPVSDWARAGITTVVGLLGTDTVTRGLPSLLARARALEHHGLTALCWTGGDAVPPPTLTGSVRGDLVHVDRFVGIGEVALSDHRSSQPTFEELLRLAADAHVAGMLTGKAGLLHLHLGDGPRGLALVRRALDETELPARVFLPTHCNRNPTLWAEARELSARGGWIDVTAGPPDGGLGGAEALVDWLDRGLDPARVTLSSDAGGSIPCFDATGALTGMSVGSSGALLETVRACVDSGVPLARALAPCTANAATLLRLPRKGRVAPGCDADLVVLEDGLRPWLVLARGRALLREGLPVEEGLFGSAS